MSTIRSILRRALGLQGEPRQLTEDDLRIMDHVYALLVASMMVVTVSAVLLLFATRTTC